MRIMKEYREKPDPRLNRKSKLLLKHHCSMGGTAAQNVDKGMKLYIVNGPRRKHWRPSIKHNNEQAEIYVDGAFQRFGRREEDGKCRCNFWINCNQQSKKTIQLNGITNIAKLDIGNFSCRRWTINSPSRFRSFDFENAR